MEFQEKIAFEIYWPVVHYVVGPNKQTELDWLYFWSL